MRSPSSVRAAYAVNLAAGLTTAVSALRLLEKHVTNRRKEFSMGRILIGVIIGIILVIWLFTSCVGAIF